MTKLSLDARNSEYPNFLHKWTKELRQYTLSDLYLPETLSFVGNIPDWKTAIVAVGGTRSPSAETFRLVSKVIRVIAAEGVIVVSGGVPGVDLSAHLAAMDVQKGVTLAVMANPANMALGGHEWESSIVNQEILTHGGFISEYEIASPIFSEPFKTRLLERDRIISGICDIFVAFECSEDSATIDTARRAIVQGKSVFGINSMGRTCRCGIDRMSLEEFFLDANIIDHAKIPSYEIGIKIAQAAKSAASKRNRI